MIEWIKKHKWTTLIIIVFLVSMFFASQFIKLLVVNSGKPVYGDRLDRVQTIEITKTNVNNLEKGLKENPKVKDVEYSLSGKVIGVKINLEVDTATADAKTIGASVLNYFDKEQQGHYGIQIFLVKTGEHQSFPIIGYKHYTAQGISWTKDR